MNASIVLISLPAIFRGIGLKPLDPANTPYVLMKDQCDVDLDRKSVVPYK